MLRMDNTLSEQQMKYAAMQQAQTPYGERLGPLGGSMGSNLQSARPNLRERVAMDLEHAERQSRKRDRLAELQMLLDKHPEVARIFDLLDDVRG